MTCGIVRLRDAMERGMRGYILSTYDDATAREYLRNRASKWERDNSARTYLAVDTGADRMVGFFTVRAVGGSVGGRPAFVVARIGYSSDAARGAIVRCTAELFGSCATTMGGCTVTAVCGSEECADYLGSGYEMIARKADGRAVMLLDLRLGRPGRLGGTLPPRCRERRPCAATCGRCSGS